MFGKRSRREPNRAKKADAAPICRAISLLQQRANGGCAVVVEQRRMRAREEEFCSFVSVEKLDLDLIQF